MVTIMIIKRGHSYMNLISLLLCHQLDVSVFSEDLNHKGKHKVGALGVPGGQQVLSSNPVGGFFWPLCRTSGLAAGLTLLFTVAWVLREEVVD